MRDLPGARPGTEDGWFTLSSLPKQVAPYTLIGIIALVESRVIATIASVLLIMVIVALLLPGVAVLARRLHDTGRSGLWFRIASMPLIGGIVLLMFLVAKGTAGENACGPEPQV